MFNFYKYNYQTNFFLKLLFFLIINNRLIFKRKEFSTLYISLPRYTSCLEKPKCQKFTVLMPVKLPC